MLLLLLLLLFVVVVDDVIVVVVVLGGGFVAVYVVRFLTFLGNIGTILSPETQMHTTEQNKYYKTRTLIQQV